jgi:hypothetical protein
MHGEELLIHMALALLQLLAGTLLAQAFTD